MNIKEQERPRNGLGQEKAEEGGHIREAQALSQHTVAPYRNSLRTENYGLLSRKNENR